MKSRKRITGSFVDFVYAICKGDEVRNRKTTIKFINYIYYVWKGESNGKRKIKKTSFYWLTFLHFHKWNNFKLSVFFSFAFFFFYWRDSRFVYFIVNYFRFHFRIKIALKFDWTYAHKSRREIYKLWGFWAITCTCDFSFDWNWFFIGIGFQLKRN